MSHQPNNTQQTRLQGSPRTTKGAYFNYFDHDLPRDHCPPAILSILTCSQKELVVFHFSGSAVLPFHAKTVSIVRNPCPTLTRNDYWRIAVDIGVSHLCRGFSYAYLDALAKKYLDIEELHTLLPKTKYITPRNCILTDHTKTLSEDVSDLNGNIFTAAFNLNRNDNKGNYTLSRPNPSRIMARIEHIEAAGVVSLTTMGMTETVKLEFGFEMEEGEQQGNWQATELSGDVKKYAAMKAFLSLGLFEKLHVKIEERRSGGAEISMSLYMFHSRAGVAERIYCVPGSARRLVWNPATQCSWFVEGQFIGYRDWWGVAMHRDINESR
ncbi:hypothetical protein B0H10DRAFT_1967161 [Mycena sp. CBHHK59/15]|nr:hypothetical protein B0H10DRAFT_1967161 [Mycena sp. CBHHK59/15]